MQHSPRQCHCNWAKSPSPRTARRRRSKRKTGRRLSTRNPQPRRRTRTVPNPSQTRPKPVPNPSRTRTNPYDSVQPVQLQSRHPRTCVTANVTGLRARGPRDMPPLCRGSRSFVRSFARSLVPRGVPLLAARRRRPGVGADDPPALRQRADGHAHALRVLDDRGREFV